MRRSNGQSTVEFALMLPLFVLFLFALVQVALIARDEVLVVHAARAAVREASVDVTGARAIAAARHALPRALVVVHRGASVGDRVVVDVEYVSHTNVPLVGPLVPDVTLRSRAVMRVER
jgi:TadE-like protein